MYSDLLSVLGDCSKILSRAKSINKTVMLVHRAFLAVTAVSLLFQLVAFIKNA